MRVDNTCFTFHDSVVVLLVSCLGLYYGSWLSIHVILRRQNDGDMLPLACRVCIVVMDGIIQIDVLLLDDKQDQVDHLDRH